MTTYYLKKGPGTTDMLAEQSIDTQSGERTITIRNAESCSDGFHTFDELYEHRYRLFITVCRAAAGLDAIAIEHRFERDLISEVWRSKMHADGTMFDGHFILGIGKEMGKQISYHLPLSFWPETEFAETLEYAPEFDGHTPADVLERLKTL